MFSRWLIEPIDVLTLLGKMTTYVSGRDVQYFYFLADFYNTMLSKVSRREDGKVREQQHQNILFLCILQERMASLWD